METRNGSQILIHETFATLSEANAFRDRYIGAYHPAGYGTRLVVVTDDNGWVVQGMRWNSCD